MARRYLYVMDPLERVNPVEDTTYAFLLEAQARGVENFVCGVTDLWCEGRRGFAQVRPASVRRPTEDDASHCALGEAKERPFDDFSVIWMRKDPPVDDVFMLATMILDRHDAEKTLLMNNPSSLRVANEKLWALFADDLAPETVVSARPAVLRRHVERWGTGVIKPASLAGGAGVLVLGKDDKNLGSALDLLTVSGTRPAIAQAFLPEISGGDKRVILLGGEPIGAVLRVPQASDNRANMHVGGSVKQAPVDEIDRKIAHRIGPELVRLGLHFVGIDVIGDKLTEVNVTSPTGVQEIDRLDGRTGDDRMPAQVMAYVERLLQERGVG